MGEEIPISNKDDADPRLARLVLDWLTVGVRHAHVDPSIEDVHFLRFGSFAGYDGLGNYWGPKTVADRWEMLGMTWGEELLGLGLGPKIVGGELTAHVSLKFFVREKGDPGNKLRIPKLIDLPGMGRIVTDVEEVGAVELQQLEMRARPAEGGYSIGHPLVSGGSIGCLVRDRGSEDYYILSAGHVLSDYGRATMPSAVLQPSKNDGGTAVDAIAPLARLLPLNYSGTYIDADAAIAGPVSPSACRSQIALLNKVPRGVRAPKYGMSVQKVGRGSDYTTGKVTTPLARFGLPYPKPGGGKGTVNFVELIVCSSFTTGGDSGSLVLDMRGYAVGLHLAGSVGKSSICIPIRRVLDALKVDLVTHPV